MSGSRNNIIGPMGFALLNPSYDLWSEARILLYSVAWVERGETHQAERWRAHDGKGSGVCCGDQRY